jgi:glycosyltransferase involved in cell wall biosynthesis
MHIAVDATCWPNRRGFGRHTRALLRALARVDGANRFTAVVDFTDRLDELPAGFARRVVTVGRPTSAAASARGRRRLRDLAAMSRALADRAYDAILFPTLYSYVPVFTTAKKIAMIHDVTAETYPRLTLADARARLLWKLKVSAACRQGDAFIAVSEFARAGILTRLGLPGERVHVAGEAPDPVFRRLADARPTSRLLACGVPADAPLLVYVGGFSPHKNVDLLVAAFAAILATHPECRLVLAGELESEVFHSALATVRERVAACGVSDRVCFTDYLPDDDLAVLLNLATVLVLPSMMEGFGLPAVEAAACGCPVIATAASPLPALLGDAAEYVRPGDAGDLRRALLAVLGSPRRRAAMRAGGLAAAARLSWDEAAARVAAVIAETVRA